MKKEIKTEPQTEKNNSHLAGEYFVAAELYRRGFSVGMTIGNAKSIDLFANKDSKTISVQVKAIKNKNSVGWPMTKGVFIDGVVYVFVNLNDFGKPEYYILTAKEAKEKFKQYKTRGIITLTPLKTEQYQERWDKITA
ncbi:MAG: hypothetical protein A2033_04730 [Bacteroidetes bacterium GWA2_31_9]|nr:MAG: hypothetical protein A2033_04730 [Bacteroidetes bacterium GWA2_31_9]